MQRVWGRGNKLGLSSNVTIKMRYKSTELTAVTLEETSKSFDVLPDAGIPSPMLEERQFETIVHIRAIQLGP